MPETLHIDPVVMDRIQDAHPRAESLLGDERVRHAVAVVTHASRSLTRLLVADEAALGVLASLDDRPPAPQDDSLQRWVQHELLRVAARDLTGIDSLEVVGERLSSVADDVLSVAVTMAGATTDLAVIGMGKLGGRELNYASDIDVMFVGDAGNATVRQVLATARKCFKVDVALRPEGQAGVLVRSVESYKRYWEQWASTWEFQALLKARAITGSHELCEQWTSASAGALWSRTFGSQELRDMREMKARSEGLINRRGLGANEIKRGRGGIRDVEFAVQLLQLVHGINDGTIRSPTTLTALSQLAEGGYIDHEDAGSMASAYRFLRTIEHRLQLTEQQQTHTVPHQPDDRAHIATVMGYSLDDFDSLLRDCQTDVRHAHERLYFRPLLEAFAGSEQLGVTTVEARLNALGFVDTDKTRSAVKELTRGLTRSSRLMRQMMPLLLDWLSSSPDPDVGLLGLRTVISGFRTPSHVIAAFRDSPDVARRLCLLLGTSRSFARALLRDPELFDALNQDTLVPTEPVHTRLERHPNTQRFKGVEHVRISMASALGITDDATASLQRSDLADAVLDRVLADTGSGDRIALIAMGRYGGNELSPTSDLDVIVVHDGSGPAAQGEADAVARVLLTTGLYEIDYDLRPEGKQGPVAKSIEACSDYYTRWASTWERQALIRARHAAGNGLVAQRFFEAIEPFVWALPPDGAQVKEIRRLKARMETERLSRRDDPQFHLKLGPGSLSDVEWTVQLLQLHHGVRTTSTMEALAQLRAAGVIDNEHARILEDAWSFCQLIRNRLHLINDSTTDALPANPQRLAVLARSLGMTPFLLRETYQRRTRLCRNVTEQLFYERTRT